MRFADKIISTPPENPILLYDGECGFCHYWALRLQHNSGDVPGFDSFQRVMHQYPEIDEKEFSRSVKLIDKDGAVYSGAAASYLAFDYGLDIRWPFKLYISKNWFRAFSDFLYQSVSANRPFLYKCTVALWGKNPVKPKMYWILWIMLLVAVIAIMAYV